MVASSKVETARWNVAGEEPVTTDAGTFPALRLTRRPAAGEDEPTIDPWLVLDSRIAPLRVRITEINGRALDQVIVAQ